MADWYCQIDQTVHGPLDAHDLRRLAEAGTLQPASLVKKTATGKWVPASQVKGLTFGAKPAVVNKTASSELPAEKRAVVAERTVSANRPSRPVAHVPYFESSRPPGDARCSDYSCPCGEPGAPISQGTGYLYISDEVVEFRQNALSEDDARVKIRDILLAVGNPIANPEVLANPILMCRLGADKRGLDLDVAARDAEHWWQTGQVPLRPTPMLGQASTVRAGSAVPKSRSPGPVNPQHSAKMQSVLSSTIKEMHQLLKIGGFDVDERCTSPRGRYLNFLAATLPLACRKFYDHEFPKDEGFGRAIILDFTGADFSGGTFASMMFEGQFDKAKFMDANLDKTFWSIANMKGADFSRASLRDSILWKMSCSGCRFQQDPGDDRDRDFIRIYSAELIADPRMAGVRQRQGVRVEEIHQAPLPFGRPR